MLETQDYVFGLGVLPNLEIQRRFKEQPSEHHVRDLLANVKYQIPQFNEYLHTITIGIQDLGSESNFYEGYDPQMDFESEKYLMNRNRMNVEYIKDNAERLLDTF